MTEHEKHVWWWIGVGLVAMTICVMGYVYSLDDSRVWRTAKNANTVAAYREFYALHRTSKFADEALSRWKSSLQKLREGLDLMDFQSVGAFLKDYPEFDEGEVREAQYKIVIENETYQSLYAFYVGTGAFDKHHDAVERLIDEMVVHSIEEAERSQDIARLRQLAKCYADWKESAKIANEKASAIQDFLEKKAAEKHLQEAKHAWESLRESKDEEALFSFVKKYSDTSYSEWARMRAECLYDDYAFVKGRGTLAAYRKYLERNPNGKFAADANERLKVSLKQLIDQEVEDAARGNHENLLEPHRMYARQFGYGNEAKVSFENSTDYSILVLYSGKVQSYKKLIGPHGSATLSVRPGVYKIAVKAKDSDIKPFYAEILLGAGVYSEEFRIPTIRQGKQVYGFPKIPIPKSKYSSRR